MPEAGIKVSSDCTYVTASYNNQQYGTSLVNGCNAIEMEMQFASIVSSSYGDIFGNFQSPETVTSMATSTNGQGYVYWPNTTTTCTTQFANTWIAQSYSYSNSAPYLSWSTASGYNCRKGGGNF
ncbi:MAG: hypothetical protein ABSE64_02380 [Vulcanimicrobiaceae bacterium]